MMMKTDHVVVEQSFFQPKEVVWKAITQVDQLKQWFFENIENFEAKPGFKTRFVVENEGRVFPHLWTITEVQAEQKITYNWKYESYEGDSYVCFELFETDGQTSLRLSHDVTESFPQHIPEFTREACEGGWNYFIKERLVEYLRNR